MFGRTELDLQKSWLTGAIGSAALLRPVLDARRVCAWTELEVRALRDSLQSVFEQWRNEKGILPDDSNSGLLGNLYEGKPLDECPPYKCAGASVWDYPGLLAKLTAEQYPPLMELEAEADNLCNPPSTLPAHIPRLPTAATKPGMQRIHAALILAEAAASNVESATKAHWELSRIQTENQRRLDEGMRAGNQMMYTLAMKGVKFIPGGSRRSAKVAFQKAAELLFKANGYNINKTIQEPALAEFRRKHYGEHTLRDWLREIRPEGAEVKGRPKKT
ncbi:MAG TPA: hypothetical protein VN283_06350 [Thiobacillus sp.]|nr:hypothetical protein [Thiobacillus sp.]